MKAFLQKYRFRILYWVTLCFLVIYFAPLQTRYYLDKDIKHFKKVSFTPALIWIFALLIIALFSYLVYESRSFKRSISLIIQPAIYIVVVIFLFQDIWLGIALWANRLIDKKKVEKIYTTSFFAGGSNSKNDFNPYDPSEKAISTDQKLINKLYRTGLKKDDTLILSMHIGLFGLPFSQEQFNEDD